MNEAYETFKSYLLSLNKGELQGDEAKNFIKGLNVLVSKGELTKEQYLDLLLIHSKQTKDIDEIP